MCFVLSNDTYKKAVIEMTCRVSRSPAFKDAVIAQEGDQVFLTYPEDSTSIDIPYLKMLVKEKKCILK